MKRIIPICLFAIATIGLTAQSVARIEGYVFESGNRGYLEGILLEVFDQRADTLVSQCLSNGEGFFSCKVPTDSKFTVKASHEYFHSTSMSINTLGVSDGEKSFLKFELKRSPGYLFEITIAEEREDDETPVDAIKSSKIEVYNNTTKEMVLVLDDYQNPDFEVHLKKGNHYTLMIRKDGYLTKRMEAFVDVKGCILCFEGVGQVRPGVTDNLTENNSFGTLLANVELERLYPEMEIKTNTIYYEAASYELSEAAKIELDKLRLYLMDNPNLVIELGSHTDSRGNHIDNLELSQKRANTAVEYVLKDGTIESSRLKAKGYGFTQVLNHCKFGVECSNEDHAVNRRTELKLLNILKEGKYITRSLASMKQLEHMDALLAEIQGEGVVEVPEDTELNSGSRKNRGRINKEFKEKSRRVQDDVSSAVSDLVNEESEKRTFEDFSDKEIEESTEVKQEEEAAVLDVKEVATEVVQESTQMVSEEVEIIEEIKEVESKKEIELKEEVRTAVEEELEVKKAVLEEKTENNVKEEMKSEVIEEMTIDKTKEQDVFKLEENVEMEDWMTGHHIVLTETDSELAESHPIFLIFQGVNEIKSPISKKHMYLYGGFETKEEAASYMESNVQKMFPGAYLISF